MKNAVEFAGANFGEEGLGGLTWRYDKNGNIRVASDRPQCCLRCVQSERLIHAHGTYKRNLLTLMAGSVRRVKLHIQRWYCPVCKRTMSTPPPQVFPYVASCALVIAIVLWVDLADQRGVHSAKYDFLRCQLSEQTIQRYRKRAQAQALFTQQFIRRVVLEKKEPEPAEGILRGGLSPPAFWERKYGTKTRKEMLAALWTGLWLLINASNTCEFNPSFILTRARQKATNLKQPFLI